METKAEILAWLREQIAHDATFKISRSGHDGGSFRDGWAAALEWVTDEIEGTPPCS